MRNPCRGKIGRAALAALALAGCATAQTPPVTPQGPVRAADVPDGWRVSGNITREAVAQRIQMFEAGPRTGLAEDYLASARRRQFYTIVKDAGGRWRHQEGADLRDPNVEELWLDPKLRWIGMVVKDNLVCAGQGIDVKWRATVGYTICNSNFARAVPEERLYRVTADEYAFVEAAKQAGLFAKAEALGAKEEAAIREKQKQEQAAQADFERAQAMVRATREQQRAQERAAIVADAERMRAKLAVGDETHCGMVIEVKRPIVKIQTMIGEKWLRLDQVFPAGRAPCRFVNQVYQDP